MQVRCEVNWSLKGFSVVHVREPTLSAGIDRLVAPFFLKVEDKTILEKTETFVHKKSNKVFRFL
jgi:hypothetical protein